MAFWCTSIAWCSSFFVRSNAATRDGERLGGGRLGLHALQAGGGFDGGVELGAALREALREHLQLGAQGEQAAFDLVGGVLEFGEPALVGLLALRLGRQLAEATRFLAVALGVGP